MRPFFTAVSYDNSHNWTQHTTYTIQKIKSVKKKIRSEESCDNCTLPQERWTVNQNAAIF